MGHLDVHDDERPMIGYTEGIRSHIKNQLLKDPWRGKLEVVGAALCSVPNAISSGIWISGACSRNRASRMLN